MNAQLINGSLIGALKRCLCIAFIALGFVLFVINLYGLTQSIRKPDLGINDHDQLRFIPEKVVSYQQTMRDIDSLNADSGSSDLAKKANQLVHRGLIHVDWKRVDADEYRQLIPLWENYFLYAIGRYSGLPQFQRYHYADFRRSIKRGIGICGDASIALSSILDENQISNRIVSFAEHVIVEYNDESGESVLLDPDFGVVLGVSLKQLESNPGVIHSAYKDAGYSEKEAAAMVSIYQDRYALFDDTYHFMTKRYIFEKISYIAKWLLPVFLIIVPAIFLIRNRRIKSKI